MDSIKWKCKYGIMYFKPHPGHYQFNYGKMDVFNFQCSTYQEWKYYRGEKQDFERFLIFFNIKMSAKLNKTELSEKFMVMWRESADPLGCYVPFVSRQK